MDIRVRVLGLSEDGFHKVQIKRLYGSFEEREFSTKALEEYLEKLENYCIYKGYKFYVAYEEVK